MHRKKRSNGGRRMIDEKILIKEQAIMVIRAAFREKMPRIMEYVVTK